MSALHDSLRHVFSGRLLTATDETRAFTTDWRGRWSGRAFAVAQPESTADVSAVLRWCSAHRVPVVPQGGNTGLSGGSVPDAGGRSLVLSLVRLNRVRELDAANLTLTAEAGCTLAQVQQAAHDAGRLFPLSLAAEGSCTIGGNLATNAGGVQVLRYGNARELCLGLEVVTAEGRLFDGLRGLRKDNTGYDLRGLYIGSEGTLGVITAAVLKLFPRPSSRSVAFVAVPSAATAVELLEHAQARLGAALTAFELIGAASLELVVRHMPGARSPLAASSPWYVLIEASEMGDEARAKRSLEALLESALQRGLVADAAMASSLTQSKALWALRENISEAQATEGPCVKHDISLPISRIPAFLESTDAALARRFLGVRLIVFGHLGDGNLHYNLSPATEAGAADLTEIEPSMNRLVHDSVDRHGGSISAEHGLGVLRRDEAARYKSPVELDLMRSIKQALDPLGLMNPGKLLAEATA